MEKPKKKYCKREGHDSGVEYCGNCVLHKERNETIDAMSTWLEGEVPSESEISGVTADWFLKIGSPFDSKELVMLNNNIHALITRKLTGK